MPKLPSLKPKQIIKILKKQGFVLSRQTGSHARLVHPDGRATTVAIHNNELPKGTLRAILRQAELEETELKR